MDQWFDKGFTLSGVPNDPDTYIASKGDKHAILRRNFWGDLNRESEWFKTKEEARQAVAELALTGATR